MYKCSDCGCVQETNEYCYHCKSDDLFELKQCEICSDWFEELNGGCCDDCIDENINLETCYKIGEISKNEHSLNGIFGHIFTDRQIEEILMREIENLDISKDLRDFVDNDKSWFGENLKGVI